MLPRESDKPKQCLCFSFRKGVESGYVLAEGKLSTNVLPGFSSWGRGTFVLLMGKQRLEYASFFFFFFFSSLLSSARGKIQVCATEGSLPFLFFWLCLCVHSIAERGVSGFSRGALKGKESEGTIPPVEAR